MGSGSGAILGRGKLKGEKKGRRKFSPSAAHRRPLLHLTTLFFSLSLCSDTVFLSLNALKSPQAEKLRGQFEANKNVSGLEKRRRDEEKGEKAREREQEETQPRPPWSLSLLSLSQKKKKKNRSTPPRARPSSSAARPSSPPSPTRTSIRFLTGLVEPCTRGTRPSPRSCTSSWILAGRGTDVVVLSSFFRFVCKPRSVLSEFFFLLSFYSLG